MFERTFGAIIMNKISKEAFVGIAVIMVGGLFWYFLNSRFDYLEKEADQANQYRSEHSTVLSQHNEQMNSRFDQVWAELVRQARGANNKGSPVNNDSPDDLARRLAVLQARNNLKEDIPASYSIVESDEGYSKFIIKYSQALDDIDPSQFGADRVILIGNGGESPLGVVAFGAYIQPDLENIFCASDEEEDIKTCNILMKLRSERAVALLVDH